MLLEIPRMGGSETGERLRTTDNLQRSSDIRHLWIAEEINCRLKFEILGGKKKKGKRDWKDAEARNDLLSERNLDEFWIFQMTHMETELWNRGNTIHLIWYELGERQRIPALSQWLDWSCWLRFTVSVRSPQKYSESYKTTTCTVESPFI